MAGYAIGGLCCIGGVMYNPLLFRSKHYNCSFLKIRTYKITRLKNLIRAKLNQK